VKPKGLLIAVVLLAVLGGLTWWSNKTQIDKSKTPADTATKLLTIPDDQFQEIKIKKVTGELLDLKRENGKHFLVTPVEKVGIRVDDAPFLAVEMVREGDGQSQMLRFRTNVDDWVACDAAHRLRFEAAADGGLTPYLHVRADLWAKVTRTLYYDLVDMGEERVVDGRPMFGVTSGGEFFAMADAEQVRGAP